MTAIRGAREDSAPLPPLHPWLPLAVYRANLGNKPRRFSGGIRDQQQSTAISRTT